MRSQLHNNHHQKSQNRKELNSKSFPYFFCWFVSFILKSYHTIICAVLVIIIIVGRRDAHVFYTLLL